MKNVNLKILISIVFVGLLFLFGCDKGVTVKFDSDGGSNVASINVTETGEVTKPTDPTKAGYYFEGWYLDGVEFDFKTQVTKSITLKAKWVEAVEVFFSGAGLEDFSLVVPKGVEYTLPVPSREGYRFVAWENDEGEELGESAIFEGETFLDAKWSKIEIYNLVYRDGDTTLKSITVTEGETVPEYNPKKTGYTFGGWYTNTDFTKKFDFENLNRSNAIYAKFIPNEYVVSFKTLSETKNISVKYDSEIGELPTITTTMVPGSVFYGWEYEGKRIYSATIFKYETDIELTPIITVKSIFNIGEDKKTVTYYVGSTGPYTEVERSGYLFAGWFANSDFTGEAMFTIDTTSYANKNLYAKYVASDDTNDLTKTIVSEVGKYYAEQFDGKTLYGNIELMGTDLFYGALVKWSSDSDKVTATGTVTRTKQNVEAHLTAKVTYNGYTETFTYTVTVKEDIYKDISKSVVTSYCYTATLGRRGIDAALLETVDIINLAFAEAQPDGSLMIPHNLVEIYNNYKEAAREAGVRTVLVVGPPTNSISNGRFSGICKDEQFRKKFVRNIVDAINEYGFAGVDIDWEYPTSETKSLFTLLMKDLCEQVKANDAEGLVTAAIPAGPYTYPNYELKNSNQYMDYINIMSYDMQGESTATHHAALYASTGGTISGCSIAETVKTFMGTSCKVPANKLVIGAAFYGRMVKTVNVSGTNYLGARVATDEKYSSITYTGIKNNYLTLSTCKEYWDSKAHAPYCYDTDSKTFISYDNPQSIKDKMDYIAENKVAGIMWWDYGSDQTGDLLAAVKSKLSVIK